jgi:hypothetical protein
MPQAVCFATKASNCSKKVNVDWVHFHPNNLKVSGSDREVVLGGRYDLPCRWDIAELTCVEIATVPSIVENIAAHLSVTAAQIRAGDMIVHVRVYYMPLHEDRSGPFGVLAPTVIV